MSDESADDGVYVLPASFGQERLWTLDLLGAGPAYNTNGAVRSRGPLAPDRLHAAIAAVVERHKVLRTTFEFGLDGGLVQVIHPDLTVPTAEHDVRDRPAGERVAAAVELVQDSVTTAFELTEGQRRRGRRAARRRSAHLAGVTVLVRRVAGHAAGEVHDRRARRRPGTARCRPHRTRAGQPNPSVAELPLQ